MPINSKVKRLYDALKADGGDVGTPEEFNSWFFKPGKEGYKNRKSVYDTFKADGADVGKNYEEFGKWLGLHAVYPTVNKYHQQMLNSVDPNKSRASEFTHRAVSQAKRGMNNVRKPVVAKVVNREGKPTGKEFAITPAKTVEDLDREYAQETTKNWENELHDQMADADKDAAKISDMFKSFIGSTDEVGSVWGNMTRGGGIAGTPHSVTTNNGILENTEARQILAAGDYNRKRKELLRLEKDSRNGAIFDNHSFFRGMYDAAKDTGFLTGGASDIINAGSLLATKQDLDNGVHTEAGDMLMQQAVKNSNAQSQYGDNQGWMYTGGVITTNMAPFIVQIASAGFSKGLSTSIGKVVQGAASKVALGTMKKAAGFASADLAKNIGKVTGLTTKAFGKSIQYGIVGAAQANTVGLGNVANDVINRYTGQVYQDEQGNYKFGTFDSDGKLVHEGGEDFLTALVKGEAAQTIEFATELAGGGIDAVGTALKNFVTKGGKKIINKYNMENVSKVIDFLLNNKVAKNARYLKAGADRTLGKVEVNSIVGESLEEELGIIANTVFTGDNKISDLWDEKQQSQIWGGMLLSIGLMKGVVAPFHAYNAKQYYSYKHKLNKADVNLSQLLGKEKWEELRNQIDATTNEDMPEMVNKINRDVALGKNRQPVREYIQNLLIMRGYDIGNMLAAKKAVEDKGEGVSVKNMEKNQAYQQGRDAYGYDTHEIQLDQEDKQKSLAQLLGISEQQLASMSDEELESFSGRDDNIDRAIYDYQLSSARYEGVVDNARDQIDLEVQRAAQAVDMYTDKSRNTIRNATIKASGGLEDYGVYIISGNIATHDDGSIDVSNSDDMILYYDPTTNTVEHADAMMFAELGSEENADEVRSQAMADAKEKAIKETTGIIDGVVEVGTQFKTVDANGTEHTYEVLADNGDGTAMITIDGNVPTELVKGENVQIPYSFEDLQKMKDEADQQRLQAAKAQREQMDKERAEQQMQSQTTQAENPAHEDNIQSAPIEDNIDYSDIIREDGKVQMVDVSDKYGNDLFPDAKDVFYIQGNKMRTKFAYIDVNGELKTQSFPTGLVKIKTRGEVSVDDYKKYRNTILAAESSFLPESSKIEDNSGENRGEIEEEAPTTEGEAAGPAEETTTSESGEDSATEQNPAAEQTPAITLEDGTIVPMLEDGNPDFSKLSAAQTAELYDSQFGEDADGIVSGYVSDAKKALDKANNMTVKGKTFVEQKAAKDAKEKAIADAQAAYDSAVAIRDAYNERQLAKEENTPEGRKSLIEKARRKYARLKNSEEWSERTGDLWNETVGKLLHRLYDVTGIDVFDDTPNTVYEYVASNVGPYSLNYEGNDNSKGVQQETGLSRSDFAKLGWLAAEGKGMTIDAKVHRLWENRPSNLESADTQEIRNALISLITSGQTAFQARDYILNQRIELAESALEEQLRQEEDVAEAQRVKEEEEKKKAELEKKAEEEKKKADENINEKTKFPDKLKDGSETIEVPEDATDENPLGLQLSEDKVPFEIEGGKSGETYNINDDEDRQRLINDNKVDDKDILVIDMPKHVHKAIKELCKKMGLKVQFLYMGARSNGWIENGTVYLALDTEKATQFVFGHEMTHAIKQKNPEAYKELVKVAMAVTTRKKFEEDLAKVYQNYHGISGYNNVDDYVEEVVADNLGKFINDFDLAQKFSLRLNHPVLATILHAIQKIKSLLYGDFYKSVDALERIVEKAYVKTAKGQVTNSETGEDVSFSLRQKPEPKKKGVGYKVFVLKDGKLYPPMVANPDGAATPVGVWLDADAAPIAGESKTGRPQVKQGGKGTQGGSGKLAYRPGWHLGVVPYAIQFNRKDADGNKTLFPKNFVFAEVEYAADVDYQEEARQEGINPSGKYQHSLAGLKHLPTDGYYMYRTNPNPETDPWVITGAMKVNRILTRAEQAELVKNAGREPQQIQEGDIVTNDVVNSINQEIADAPKFSLKVYHGSGADFTEFDFDHMGEGAGSQVFGWGGYVTSSKKIGKSYAKIGQMSAEDRHRHASSEDTPIEAAVGSILGQEIYNERAKTFEQKKAQAIENAENSIASYSDMLKNSNELDKKSKKFLEKSIERYKKELEVLRALTEEQYKEEYIKQGRAKNLYEVDIPDDNGSNYLDWENPLNEEQINAIRDALAKNGVDVSSWENRGFKLDLPFKDVYAAVLPMMMRCEPKEVSKFLSSLGFTGIKYPAGTIQGGAEEGDTNYVIFKPEDMKITQHTKFSLRLKAAIEETETNPSDAQKESGNYKKGHIKFGGYDYTIENPKGSTRSGKDADGKEWKITMHDTYGYIRGKFGKDGDHLDMFINDKADLDNWDGDVFVVDQVNSDGSFDEHKVMYGYDSMDDAEKAYLANYSKGWKGLGSITGVSKDEFDKWLDTSKRKLKPFADYAKVKFSQAQSVSEPRYSLKDIKPVGVGAFGNIYNQFRGNAKAAIEFLKKVRGGEAVGALHHKDIGDIDLVWGKEGTGHSDGYGLSKLVKYHPEVLDNLQEILNDMRVVSSSKNRVNLESETHKAGVRLTWDGERKSWLLTAFKKETSASDKRTDTAATSLEGDTALSQTEGSAAKIDNSSETAKENGEKFSLKEEKTLAGVHNITEEKLLKAIKQGGLANPSVAVIDSSKQNHENYGDISLILPSDKVAKRTGKNAGTWQGDAWTPTYPQVERQMSNKGAAKASKDVSSVPGDMYREVRRGLDRWLDGGEANSAMAYMFLHEKGVAPEPKKIQHKFSDDVYNELKSITAGDFNIYGIGKADAQKVLDMYIDAKFDGDKDLYEEKTKAWLERNKSIVDAGNKGGMRYIIAKENVELYDEYGFNYKSVQTFVHDVEYDHRKTGVDMNATLNEVEDYIKTNNQTDEFNTWLGGKEKEYGIKEVIFDGFTPSGNRRYVPNTLENVSKIMKKQGRNGATGISVSFQNFAASLMPSYGTLKDIRSKKGLLTSDYEDLDKFNEKWSKVFFELGMKCQPDATGTFDDYGLARLSEAAKASDPQAYLKKEYNVDFSDEDTKRLKEMVKAIKEESPAMYFETKFERPVGFNEFSSAVVPTTASDEVKQALQNAGVQIYEYDKEKEGDRNRAFNEAINSSDNIRFSLKAMMEKPEGWKQANKKAIHIAEAIERDPKFSLKNLDGTLIKAGTYFSGGGLVEEGLKGIIDPVVAVEYDEKISGVYRNNFGQHIVTADVRDVDPKELVKHIDGEVEYFHASPVCKNYSQAKSNHAELELDKETAASTAEFINAVKPKVVTIENVKGYKDSDAMKTITDALDANGYTWDADVYNAADYGGYTNRERLIVRAIRDGKLPAKPEKMARKSGWYEAVADIIPTLTEKKNGVAPWMDIRLKADGIDWRNIDKPLYVMGSAYADGKVPHAFADELLPTLRTKSGDVIVMPDGKVYRAMGRVLARVSGVSDDYKMPFSESLSHTIIGNGIPTQLTEHVIAPLLTGSDPKFSIRTYHGTGAKFDKFDLSHALEGEGSETFGHGVYVTNSKEIGTDYAQRAKDKKEIFGFEFVNPQSMSKEAQDMLRHYMYKHQDVAKGLENARKDLKDVIGKFPDTDYLQELNEILAKDDDSIAIPSNRAYRYDVDIPDDNGSNYLGWNESQNFPLEKWYRLWEITHEGFNENEYFKDGGARYDIDRIERITQMKLESPENGMQKLPTLKGEELYHALEDFFNRERPSYGAELASRALSEIGFVGIKYPAGLIHGGAKEGDYNYVIFDENNANIVGNTRFSLRYDKFEHDLKSYVEDGVIPENSRFELGFPSDTLLSAGFPKLPISMRVSLLNKKAGMERHPFSPTDLYNLVDAIQEPLAIFEYTKPNMRNLIVDLTKGEKHFLVGVTLDYRKGDLAVNSISGLFPKENHEWIKWIQDGKAIRIDKKDKVLSLIDSLRTNPEEAERIGLNLDFAAKIIKYFENPSVSSENTLSDTKFSLRGSTPYGKQMEEWKEKNHLEKDATPMKKPVMKEGENIFDYANRMVEWTRNQNLWKTAPKQTGFQEALDKWKADNGIAPGAYPPVHPIYEDFQDSDDYNQAVAEYRKEKEVWKTAPKPKDFDLSVDLDDMNKQLRNIRRAVLNQKNYDQRTVKAVSDLVRKMLNIGWGDGLSRGKVGNLLSAAKNATGANYVKKYLDKAMGILAENYLNRLSTAYDNLINTKGARADQSGVIKMGSLDAKGQAFMSEYKKAINMDDSSLNTYIANIEEDSAKNEDNVEMNDYRLAGIQAAIMYKQQIGGNDADIAELKRQIGELKNKKDATKEDKDLQKSLEKKLFENKFDRITMYENLLNNIQRMVKESKGRAKEFREKIVEHKNEILHRANLDLEGMDSAYYDTTTAKKKFVNNPILRFVMSSTYTFEQFLKFFGRHHANGEGYLYNYFMSEWQDAADEQQLYNEMNRNALDEKTKELFGKKNFTKLVGIDGKGMKEMDIDVTDYSNKKTGKRTIHLKQGQMLYIYLVNKETDGEMKLRAMGITEEKVAEIEKNLDPRVKSMGEWLQNEYLPECQRRYQATHTKYFGAPMKEVENYFPLAINNRARNVREDLNQDTDAISRLAGTSTGAIITRRVNVIPLDIENADAFAVAFNHLDEMEEWSAYLPFIQDVNTLLSSTHFRNQVMNMSSAAYGSGKTLWEEFKKVSQIAAGTYKPKVDNGMMDSKIAAVVGGIATAKISGRLWTAFKQTQSATTFLTECDPARFLWYGVNPYGSWHWAYDNLPLFRKRVEQLTAGDVKVKQFLDELEKYHDWTKTIAKVGMSPNILVDSVTCAVGARSVYETELNKLTKLGYPKDKAEEKAIQKASLSYNKTQQSSEGAFLSPMQVDRTYVSAALSLYKNANYAYGRKKIEAIRGIAKTYRFWGEHKNAMIGSMTRQIMDEDGLDENVANAIAKRAYTRTFWYNIGTLLNYMTIVPISWAAYKVLLYLLNGDDDDKKKKMIEEACLKGFATTTFDDYVIPFASNILNAGLNIEDGKIGFDTDVFKYQNLYINPATSDLSNIYSMIGNQKWWSAGNKFGMLGIQMLVGFNPETIGALYQAYDEFDNDSGNMPLEIKLAVLKSISAPEESIRGLYMDELGLDNEDRTKVPLSVLEQRYAERQINRDNLLSQVAMPKETFDGYVEKYKKSFEKKIQDKMDKMDAYDQRKFDAIFDTTTDQTLKGMMEKKRTKDANAAADEQIAKEGLNQEKKGKEPSEEAYEAVKMSIDVAEDNAISTYNKVLNKRYAALNDEYNEQTDAMKYIFMSKHPNFKAYKELESEYTNYGKKIKELKGKLVSTKGYDAKQTILKQIRAEREKFSELQSKVR